MIEFIKSVVESELTFISKLDYGNDSELHLEALRSVIFQQNGIINSDQFWYPYEVIELGSNCVQSSHEREFIVCTLLVVLNVIEGADLCADLNDKLNDNSKEYDKLTTEQSALILKAYSSAGC